MKDSLKLAKEMASATACDEALKQYGIPSLAALQKGSMLAVLSVSTLDGWVAGDNGAVFSTHNGGVTWELETVGASQFLRGLAVTSRAIFAVGNDGVILRRAI